MKDILKSWTRATGGVVGVLLLVQVVSGVLLAFYYVPSVDHAHQTVTFIEKVVSSGAWLRSLHHYGSQWLSLAAFLHVLQLFLNRVYEHSKTRWIAAILLLALIMAGGATGYSLPWDARAFFSTRIGEGLAGGLPFIGSVARLWLLGGTDVSTLTLSRLFALHILVIPFLITVVIAFRFYSPRVELSRHALAGGVIFLALALWTMTHAAPLGPPISEAPVEYIPRPGAQFLWLYQSLKYLPGGLGSLFGVVVPGLFLLFLLLLPRLGQRGRIAGGVLLGVASVLIVSMTTLAYLADRNDVRVRAQLQKQTAEEQAFRAKPFEPALISQQPSASGKEPPSRYGEWCAKCHGPAGQGATLGGARFPPLVGVGRRRTVEEIVGILNDPPSYGINPPMTSFKAKLSQPELREIAEWVAQLK
jgi:ubiquinol-cytochrome c reductase cytochrome b subunit